MFRTDQGTSTASLPTPTTPGTPGYFTSGNASTGVPATVVDADFLNRIQEELMSFLTVAGVTPNKTSYTQVLQSVKRLAGTNYTTVTASGTLTLDNAGVVAVNATSGSVSLTLPAANAVSGLPQFFFFVRTDTSANTVTISAAGSDNVEGSSSVQLLAKDRISVISNGSTTWYAAGHITAPLAVGGFSGLKVTNDGTTPNTKIGVTANSALLITSAGLPFFASAPSVTIDCGTTGANGLDAGSLANSTWYYVFLISNGITVAGLASTSSTAPTMPSGYTYSLRVGAMRTDGSAHFMRTVQYGKRAQYTLVGSTNTGNYPVMASGTAGSASTPTLVAVGVGSYVPPTASRIAITLGLTTTNTNAIVGPNNAFGGSASTSNPPPLNVGTVTGGATEGQSIEFALESSNIYWASGGTASLTCLGWEDNL